MHHNDKNRYKLDLTFFSPIVKLFTHSKKCEQKLILSFIDNKYYK